MKDSALIYDERSLLAHVARARRPGRRARARAGAAEGAVLRRRVGRLLRRHRDEVAAAAVHAELIFRERQLGSEMYLIKKGVVLIHKESGRRGTKTKGGLATLREGDYFGEVALVMRAARRVGARDDLLPALHAPLRRSRARAATVSGGGRKIKDMAARHRLQLYTSEGSATGPAQQRHDRSAASPFTPHRSRRPRAARRRRDRGAAKADALARLSLARARRRSPDMARHGSIRPTRCDPAPHLGGRRRRRRWRRRAQPVVQPRVVQPKTRRVHRRAARDATGGGRRRTTAAATHRRETASECAARLGCDRRAADDAHPFATHGRLRPANDHPGGGGGGARGRGRLRPHPDRAAAERAAVAAEGGGVGGGGVGEGGGGGDQQAAAAVAAARFRRRRAGLSRRRRDDAR